MPKWQELEGTDGEGNGNPLQFSHLEKSHGQRNLVGCSPWGHDWETSLSLFLSCIGGGNATPSSILAWKIPWTEEPGRLQSMGLLSVGHDWATSLSLFTFMHWRRKWQPTPVFLPGESQGQGAWWATIYGVAESQTRLKRPSSSSRRYSIKITLVGSKSVTHFLLILIVEVILWVRFYMNMINDERE